MVGTLVEVAAGYDLAFRICIALGGSPPDEVVDAANGVLGIVSGGLELT